jgi:hypothetical protein
MEVFMKLSSIGLAVSMLCFGFLQVYRVSTDSAFRSEWGLGSQLTINPVVTVTVIAASIAVFLVVGAMVSRKRRIDLLSNENIRRY